MARPRRSKRYKCGKCDAWHEGPPLHYGVEAPLAYYGVPEAEREERCLLNSDMCAIDGEHFFIVGNLEIPVLDHDEAFSWDVWVSLSKASFKRAYKLWTTPGRELEPPYFGWLSTRLPGYPDTIHLKTHVHTREVGRRPLVELEPTDHPLAVEQRTGITWDRVREIAELVMHDGE
jgi:hypothetical protein